MNIITSLFNTTKELLIKKWNFIYIKIQEDKKNFYLAFILWVFAIWMFWYNDTHHRGILTA